jgi:hypothetical protein
LGSTECPRRRTSAATLDPFDLRIIQIEAAAMSFRLNASYPRRTVSTSCCDIRPPLFARPTSCTLEHVRVSRGSGISFRYCATGSEVQKHPLSLAGPVRSAGSRASLNEAGQSVKA